MTAQIYMPKPGKGPGEKVPSGYRAGRISNFTPQQMELFQQLFQNLGPESYLSQLAQGGPEAFAEQETPALKQFSELQGNLASRFSGMGSGARRSSGFQNTMNQATTDFAQQLQSQRQGLQRQALYDLLGLSESLLQQQPYTNTITQKRQNAPSFLQQLGSSFAGSAAESAGSSMFGGGSKFANLFKSR